MCVSGPYRESMALFPLSYFALYWKKTQKVACLKWEVNMHVHTHKALWITLVKKQFSLRCFFRGGALYYAGVFKDQ